MRSALWYTLMAAFGLNGGWWIAFLSQRSNVARTRKTILWLVAMTMNFSIVIALGEVLPTRLLSGNQPLYGCGLLAVLFSVGFYLAKVFLKRRKQGDSP